MVDAKWQLGIALGGILLLSVFLWNIERFFPNPQSEIREQEAQVNIPTDATRGKYPGAPHTLVEFTDFQCPYCRAAIPVLTELESLYGDNLNIIVLHFPVGELHPDAPKAAEAAECARIQGKFWEYHNLLFQNQEDLSVPALLQYAQILGLDETSFNSCLTSGERYSQVEADVRLALSLGVQGTPTFFADGHKIEGLQPSSSFIPPFGVTG